VPDSAAVRIAVLLSPSSSLAMALLFRAVFERANRRLAARRYHVTLASAQPVGRLSAPDVTVRTRSARGRCDYLVVTPYEGIEPGWRPDPADVALVRRQHARGAVVASSCLGALTLAEAGLLETREATTHWSWAGYVRGRYPRVAWNTRRIVCDQGTVITAGGYLATIDLALHIIAANSSRTLAHELGRMMLADSAREHQSIYALRLADPAARAGPLSGLEAWLDARLRSAPTAGEMAKHCNMSLRSFHRRFREAYGVTPRKYLQLKRVEAVRRILGDSRRGIAQILEEVGVSDVTSFRRIFQRELGHSPAQFRRRLRGGCAAREAKDPALTAPRRLSRRRAISSV
jgi:transcriptional regulator GlxA family with amidase domain